ncbi:hypothetical protein [Streptomyces sp. cg2]|uniref:hypothetical protein n=1 Tax=Streptomyces sp. cg2 TaxID=3238799 RepID=UPI0034E29F3E
MPLNGSAHYFPGVVRGTPIYRDGQPLRSLAATTRRRIGRVRANDDDGGRPGDTVLADVEDGRLKLTIAERPAGGEATAEAPDEAADTAP